MEIDWGRYLEIAGKFKYKAKAEDREDLKSDIVIRLAEIANRRNGDGEELTYFGMLRVAKYVVLAYWRDIMRKPPIISLNSEITDKDGDSVELWETLIDDKVIDLESWLDAKTWLLGCPIRLIQVAYKKEKGLPLNDNDRNYLYQQRKKYQKKLAFI